MAAEGRRRRRRRPRHFDQPFILVIRHVRQRRRRRRGGGSVHSQLALILNKEVYRHVRQRRRRRRGGGSAQCSRSTRSTAATRSEAATAGTDKSIDYATTPFLGSPSPCPSIRPYDHQLYCSMAGFALLRWVRTLLICHSCCAGPLSLDITNPLTPHLS